MTPLGARPDVDNPSCRSASGPPTPADRLEWLLLATALAVVVLVYPLRLHDEWLGLLNGWWAQGSSPWARWSAHQLQPFLSFYHSPLVLKGVLAALALLMFIAVRLSRLSLGLATTSAPWRHWLLPAAFIVWMALATLWSPTPAVSREAALWTGLYGFAFWLLLRRGLVASEMRHLAWLLMTLGTIVIVVMMLQALPAFGGWIFKFMYHFEDARNIHGSLIGHNTAAASFLLLTAFPALGLALGTGSERVRAACACYLVLAAFGMIIAQSRAIWILAPLLGLPATLALARRAGVRRWRPLPLVLLALLTLGFASQLIPGQPLYREGNPLARRLRDLTPESLVGESRLRLNVIGWPLVAERPLVGHGLHSFQFVYPPAQGLYFNRHPESPLNQTPFRPHMAHNEYLQTAIEGGLIGLTLLFAALGELYLRGRRRDEGDLNRTDAVLRRAFGWATLGLAVHAAVDFPFHVPQLLVPWMLCATAWGHLRRDEAFTAVAMTTHLSAPSGSLRLVPMLRLLGLALAVLAVPLVARPFFLRLQADVQSNTGNGYLMTYNEQGAQYPTQARIGFLEEAIRRQALALRLVEGEPMARLRLADARLRLGVLLEAIAAGADSADEPVWRSRAIEQLERAIEDYAEADRGMSFYYIYHNRAHAHAGLARLTGDEQHERAYRDDLERTLLANPSTLGAAHELAALLDRLPGPRPAERALQLRRLIHRMNPHQFDEWYVFPAFHALGQQRYAEALTRWRGIAQIDPQNIHWQTQLVQAELMAGNREQARQLAETIYHDHRDPYFINGVWYFELMITGDWERLLELMVSFALSVNRPADVAEKHLVEQEALARLGRAGQMNRFPRPDNIEPAYWERLLAERRPGLLLFFFNEPTRARAALDERLALNDIPPSFGFWADAWYIARAIGDEDLAGRALAEMERIDPRNHTLLALRAQTTH